MKAAASFGLVALACACSSNNGSSDSSNSGDDDTSVTGVVEVSGGTIYHSINRLATELSGNTPDYSELAVKLVASEALRADPSAPALASTALPAGCATTGSCNWSHGAVDLDLAKEGLIAELEDERSEPIWVTTFTGFFDGAELAAAKSAGQTAGGRAFAVSREAVELVLAPMAGLASDELLQRGLIFGLVYDPTGKPLSGATVEPSDADLTIVYPNDRFTGVETETTMQGAFLAIPSGTGPAETSFTVTAPSGSALTWDTTELSLVVPGSIYFGLLYASP